MALETTLILFKPDAIEKNLTGKVLARFEDAGFVIRAIKMMKLDDAVLREHYSHIADKPFFPEIVKFMSKTPVIALALQGEDVINKVRDLLGPTNSKGRSRHHPRRFRRGCDGQRLPRLGFPRSRRRRAQALLQGRRGLLVLS
jgi:nucleoside diphosphate kinase